MGPDELELCETSLLIEELLRRSTFQGVIIHAETTPRAAHWAGERIFKLRFNDNFTAAQVGNLLGVVADYVHEQP